MSVVNTPKDWPVGVPVTQDTLEEWRSKRPSARVICDSISPNGVRLTTLEVRMHRFVLAEFNTHRVFSRNSASSRAIPMKKTLERVRTNPAMPVFWGKNQPGMQATTEFEGAELEEIKRLWLELRDINANYVERFEKLGLHKQIANRPLEPWQWHTVIVTATQFSNFFTQRCNLMAQPEMRVAAEAAEFAYFTSTPTLVDYCEWHLPFIMDDEKEKYSVEILRKASVARCARVSYLTHDGVRDIDKDLDLFEKLISSRPMHASPLEHVATPASYDEICQGNFRGWKQYRHMIPGNTAETYKCTNPDVELIKNIFGTNTPSVYSQEW